MLEQIDPFQQRFECLFELGGRVVLRQLGFQTLQSWVLAQVSGRRVIRVGLLDGADVRAPLGDLQ